MSWVECVNREGLIALLLARHRRSKVTTKDLNIDFRHVSLVRERWVSHSPSACEHASITRMSGGHCNLLLVGPRAAPEWRTVAESAGSGS